MNWRNSLIAVNLALLAVLSLPEPTGSSTSTVYDIDIARGVYNMDLSNDTSAYILDAIVFHDAEGHYYTIRYKIATENLTARIRQNTSKDIPVLITRSIADVNALAHKLRYFALQNEIEPDALIMALVQNGIRYRRDDLMDLTYARNYRDYYKYAVETLFDKNGDCEDKVILSAALLSAIGYQVGYVEVPGHIILAVEGDYPGPYFYEKGTKYFLWETTSAGHSAGEIDYNTLPEKSFSEVNALK